MERPITVLILLLLVFLDFFLVASRKSDFISFWNQVRSSATDGMEKTPADLVVVVVVVGRCRSSSVNSQCCLK